MLFQILADLVLLLHGAFIVFVILGALLAIRWLRIMWIHLPACAWAVLLEFCGWLCPLTPLENWLRRLGGETEYSTGFIEHYLAPVIYPEALGPGTQALLGISVVLVNALLYLHVFRVRQAQAPPA
jgi:hypothetical protein